GKPNPTPTQVAGISNVKAVSAGYHSLALGNDGNVWTWGNNQYGQLGNTTNAATTKANPSPAQVSGLSGVTAIAAGWYHSLVLRNDGTVWAWGNNSNGELGNDINTSTTTATPSHIPAQVNGEPPVGTSV